jgi:hypothetical protein
MWLVKTCVWGLSFVGFRVETKSKHTYYEHVRAIILGGVLGGCHLHLVQCHVALDVLHKCLYPERSAESLSMLPPLLGSENIVP